MLQIQLGFRSLAVSGSQPRMAIQLKLQNHVDIFFDNSKSLSRHSTKQLKLQNHVRYFWENSKSEGNQCCKYSWGFVVQLFQAANQGWLSNSNYKNTSIFSSITQNLESVRQPNSLNYKTTSNIFGRTQNPKATNAANIAGVLQFRCFRQPTKDGCPTQTTKTHPYFLR